MTCILFQVRLYQVIETPSKLYLILELGDGGDMFDYIMRHDKGLHEDKAKEYFGQVSVDCILKISSQLAQSQAS